MAEHISGSSSFKLGREPEEEAPKASELNVDFRRQNVFGYGAKPPTRVGMPG